MKKKLLSVLSLGLFAFSTLLAYENSYGIPEGIQEGNILHCFNWSYTDIKNELKSIAEAGYGAVQLSPQQRGDVQKNWNWSDVYRPYDMKYFPSAAFGTEAQFKEMIAEAHTYGIKVIVDVVANHVDGSSGYHDVWWDSNGRYRSYGPANINYGNRSSITHDRMGEYYELNSENSEVIARTKAYIQSLKDMGVDGIRWDAAKHIALPSERDGGPFWKEVTSIPGLYHYGEILDTPGGNNANALMKEYTTYMSVTDNSYGNNARKNGGVPTSNAGWGSGTISEDKCVYWGESHDTYSNTPAYGGDSKYVDQSVVDRAYASVACRNKATALYFARPDGTEYGDIRLQKGSKTAYKSKTIAQINKFRNVMNGRADYFTYSGSACSITRQGGGAVIVMKGSGAVSIANGGSFCPEGTYTDRVSGGTFTVTASTISGNVGSSGIAVIYGEELGEYDPDLGNGNDDDVSSETVTVYYDNSVSKFNEVYVYAYTPVTAEPFGSWPGKAATKVEGDIYSATVPSNCTVIFNNNNKGSQTDNISITGDHIYIATGVTSSDEYGNTVYKTKDNGTYSSGGNDGNDNPGDTGSTWNIYFDNSKSNWGNVWVYAYTPEILGKWPGTEMNYDYASGYYKLSTSEDLTGYNLIFNTLDNGNQTGDGVTAVNNGIYNFTGHKETQGVFTGEIYGDEDSGDKDPGHDDPNKGVPAIVPEGQFAIFVKASEAPYIWVWDDNNDYNKGAGWPGNKMTLTCTDNKETTYYYWVAPASATSVNCILSYSGDSDKTANLNNITKNTYFEYNGSESAGKVLEQNPVPADITIISSDENDEENGDDGEEDDDNKGDTPADTFNVYFDNRNSNWVTPYIHYWGSVASTYPGEPMNYLSGSVWSYAVPAGTTGLLFNAGDGDDSKTDDFVASPNHIYTTSGDQGEYKDNNEDSGEPGDSENIDLYILGNIHDCQWDTANSPKLEYDGQYYTGIYTLELPNTRVDEEDANLCYFSFATSLGDSWDALNMAADRYGSEAEGQKAVIGENTLTLYANNVNASGCQSFTIPEGMYYFKVNLSNLTMTIAEVAEVDDPENPDGGEVEPSDPTDPENPGSGDVDPSDPENPGSGDVDPSDPENPGSGDVDPSDPENPGSGDVDPSDPENPGSGDVDPSDPENPGSGDVDPSDPENPGSGDVDPSDPENPGSGDVDPSDPENPGSDDVDPSDPEDPDAGIESVGAESAIQISTSINRIDIEGGNGEYIAILTFDGRILLSKKLYDSVSINVMPGLYIVNVNGKGYKIAVR